MKKALSPSQQRLVEGAPFNFFAGQATDLICTYYENSSKRERAHLDLVDVAKQEFHENQTSLLQQLILLEANGAKKKDLIAGMNHFIRFFDAHKLLFENMKELVKTL